ncbi:rab-GTPase-TBC domain-containing protein [Lyophyllum atratum]|nr:rab-GTPase-TBC domain-containing protein [Lyophyllum atratum]
MRDAALADRLLPPSSSARGVIGRSIAWKLFLTSEEPLQPSSAPVRGTSLLQSQRYSRQDYVKQLREHMRAPDGSYEEGFILPGSPKLLERTPRAIVANLDTNNPLSLHNENPWKIWFASVDLRKTILQDVERTFPDIAFFREREVQVQLTNILFLYSVMNPCIGYRQGMHEVLAPLYYAVDSDSLPENGNSLEESEVREVCSRTWVAGDSWALFDSVMRGLCKWYEWREPPLNSRPREVSSALATHVNLDVPGGQLEIKPYIAPIVEACNRIQSDFLRTTDPLLWKHMQAAGIEPQIYGIRWLRLLFTREFSMIDAMKLWDGLFACDPTFELAQWVCVAMLIRIRNELIPADYTGQLTALLRYPSPRSPPAFEDAPHHTSLLLRQALTLQMSPSPSTGASIILENRNLLNIPMDVPAPPPAPQQRRNQNKATSMHGQMAPPASQGHSRQVTAPQMGLPEMIARGLLERGESLGINKTLMSAVSELRRNIPDLAASLVRSPNASHSVFPLMDDRPPEERPPWEPRTRFEMEKDISQLRLNNKRLGESLGWIVDILLQDEAESKDPQRLKKQKQEAVESLSYVRDVLMGNVAEIEEARLVGEEESLKRKSRDASSRQASENPAAVVVPPPPVSMVDSRLQIATSRNTRSRSPPQHMGSPPMSLPIGSARKASTLPRLSAGPSNPDFNRLPPWHYSRSGFSGHNTSLPAEALPRLPPPAGQKSSDQTPHSTPAQQDPLGVLR